MRSAVSGDLGLYAVGVCRLRRAVLPWEGGLEVVLIGFECKVVDCLWGYLFGIGKCRSI